MKTASLAMQCKAHNGETGTFLFTGEKPASNPPVSPVFPDMAEFCKWARDNKWTPKPGTYCAIYENENK